MDLHVYTLTQCITVFLLKLSQMSWNLMSSTSLWTADIHILT